MRKTITLVLLSVVLMISSCAILSKAKMTNGNADKMGGTVLYIAKIKNGEILAHDVFIIKRLEDMGFTVTPRYAKELEGAEAREYDYIYMSESNSSGDLKAKFIDVPNPILSCEMWIGDEMGFTSSEKGVGNGNKENVYQDIKITAPDHPIAAGLNGVVNVLSAKGTMGFGKPGGDVTIIASAADDPETAFIFAYEQGAKNMNGEVVPGLRVWHYLFENTEGITTKKAWQIWEAAVRYTFK